jgi:hypothetical protein
MSKTVAYVTICTLGLIAVGCGDEQPFKPTDFSRLNDLSGAAPDMSMRTYTAATPNQIDTSGAGGSFGKGTAVSLSGVVLTTPVTFFESQGKTRCDYEAWVQDPACTVPPCGLVIVAKGPTKAMTDNCPSASGTTTPLAMLRMGDNVDIQGLVDTFVNMGSSDPDGGTSTTVIQHEVEVDSATKTAGTATITPMPVNQNNKFTGYGVGAEWAKYEGTLITMTNTGGKLTASAGPNGFVFILNPGNSTWARTFNFAFGDLGASFDYPMPASQWTSVTGVVSLLFGGQILPRRFADFVP